MLLNAGANEYVTKLFLGQVIARNSTSLVFPLAVASRPIASCRRRGGALIRLSTGGRRPVERASIIAENLRPPAMFRKGSSRGLTDLPAIQ